MQKVFWGLILIIVLIGGFFVLNTYIYQEKQGDDMTEQTNNTNNDETTDEMTVPTGSEIQVTPISHATMILNWAGKIIYTDPVGGAAAFAGKPEADLILITDVHGDHLNLETLQAVSKDDTVIVAPQVVLAQLTASIKGTKVMLSNGAKTIQQGLSIEGVPMYNVPETPEAYHIKGRGNGYVIELDGQRVYISGDSGNTPEMRALVNIDMAFIAMNLPYTMSVEDAAAAVLAFKPTKVIPYHYRGQTGLSDTAKFEQLVNKGGTAIEVDLINFYPESN